MWGNFQNALILLLRRGAMNLTLMTVCFSEYGPPLGTHPFMAKGAKKGRGDPWAGRLWLVSSGHGPSAGSGQRKMQNQQVLRNCAWVGIAFWGLCNIEISTIYRWGRKSWSWSSQRSKTPLFKSYRHYHGTELCKWYSLWKDWRFKAEIFPLSCRWAAHLL